MSKRIGPAPYPVGMLKKQKVHEDATYRQIESHLGKEIVQGPLDPVFGQHRAFPISIDPLSVKLGTVPSTVEEYLAQVRLEAEGESMEEEEEEDSDGFYYIPPKTEEESPERSGYLEEFEQERLKYSQYRSQLTELDAIELPGTQKEWKYFVFNNEPSFDFVAQIVQEEQQVKLIAYFAKWLNTKVNESFEQWMFMVLAACDRFEAPADVSVIRSLGKKAQRQKRNELTDHNREIMDRLLVIVGHYHGQRDLLEE